MPQKDKAHKTKQIGKVPQHQANHKPFAEARGKLPEHDSSNDRLCWRLAYLDDDGPWGLGKLTHQELVELLAGIRKFETMKINEIFHNGGYPGKDYDVETLPHPAAGTRLDVMGLADMTKIWALRLSGPGRLYGFLVGNVFHIVWWDPLHEIWPNQKRHT